MDVTCSGAQTSHILGPWNELPAQLDAVSENTRLVTITIGGNDINYVGGLMGASCDYIASKTGQPRSPQCQSSRRANENSFAQLEKNLQAIGNEAKRRAPGATVIFVQYLELIPDTLCEQTPLSEEEASYAREIAARLYALTEQAAAATGAMLFPGNPLSAKHTPCDPQPWTIGLPPDIQTNPTVPWHLNARGMSAVASGLEELLLAEE